MFFEAVLKCRDMIDRASVDNSILDQSNDTIVELKN